MPHFIDRTSNRLLPGLLAVISLLGLGGCASPLTPSSQVNPIEQIAWGIVLAPAVVINEATEPPPYVPPPEPYQQFEAARANQEWSQLLILADQQIIRSRRNAGDFRYNQGLQARYDALFHLGRYSEALAQARINHAELPRQAGAEALCEALIYNQQPLEARPLCAASARALLTEKRQILLGHTYLLAGQTSEANRIYRDALLGLSGIRQNGCGALDSQGWLDALRHFIAQRWHLDESQRVLNMLKTRFCQAGEIANDMEKALQAHRDKQTAVAIATKRHVLRDMAQKFPSEDPIRAFVAWRLAEIAPGAQEAAQADARMKSYYAAKLKQLDQLAKP